MTEAGKVAAPLLDVSPTANPPVGAGDVSVSVPIEFKPPRMLAGLSERLVKVGALIVSVALAEEEFKRAVIVAET